MKRLLQFMALACNLLVAVAPADATTREKAVDPEDKSLTLWYEKPAENWSQALPVGNGRLGAMIYGGVVREELQLNEDTVWAGGPNNNVNEDSAPYVGKVIEASTASTWIWELRRQRPCLQTSALRTSPKPKIRSWPRSISSSGATC